MSRKMESTSETKKSTKNSKTTLPIQDFFHRLSMLKPKEIGKRLQNSMSKVWNNGL